MFIDNLSLAGIAVASLVILLPLFFGKEFFKVDDECRSSTLRERPQEELQQRGLRKASPDC